MSDGRTYWWEESAADVGQAVKETVTTIQSMQAGDRAQDLRHLRMYRNRQLGQPQVIAGATVGEMMGAPLSFNVVRNMADAVTSRISKNRPKAVFQTYGGTFETREEARKIEKFVEGAWYKEKVRRQTPVCCLDMTVLGTAFLKVTPGKKNIIAERVFPLEITVDKTEGMHRKPSNLYQSKYVDKFTLAKMFPDKADEIKAMVGEEEEWSESYSRFVLPENRDSNMLLVTEAYHLASEEGADDGVFAQSVQGVTLDVKPWKWTRFPFAEMRWATGQLGFFGMGLAEELAGIQVEINRLLRKVQHAMQLLSNPYVFADRSSNVAKGSVTDVPGTFIFYSGKEPRVGTASVVHPEVFAHLDRLYQRAYEIAGISQLSAQSQKPQGMESGRAMLVFNDTETERFATVAREWEDFHMQIAELTLWAAKQIPGYSVPVGGENGYDVLKFSDIDMKDKEYVMRPMPTSLLGDTPSGQIDMLERLIKGGLITSPDDMLREIESPDMQRYLYKVTSPKRVIERVLESMLAGGDYISPEPSWNLEMCAQEAQYAAAMGLLEGRSRASLANVRKFSIAATEMAKAGAPKPQPQMPVGQAGPGAPPNPALGAVPMGAGMPAAAVPMPVSPEGMPQ